MTRDRGRVTVTDTVYFMTALAALAALWPVFRALLGEAGGLRPDEQLIFTSMLPVAVLVLLAIIYVEARTGLQ